MTSTRIFLFGIVILLLGFQLRAVQTFVLNEKVTKMLNKHLEKEGQKSDSYAASAFDYGGYGEPETVPLPAKRAITPPRWLGWSLVSIGAVLIVTCPVFR